MEKPSVRFRDHLRRWWSGLLIAPLGTAVVGLMFIGVSYAFDRDFKVTFQNLGTALGIVFLMVLMSYVVGLFLLPVFLLFERLHWRGWPVYVPTASVAGIVTASLTEESAHWDAHRAAITALCAVCGALSGAVFAKGLDRPHSRYPPPVSLFPAREESDERGR